MSACSTLRHPSCPSINMGAPTPEPVQAVSPQYRYFLHFLSVIEGESSSSTAVVALDAPLAALPQIYQLQQDHAQTTGAERVQLVNFILINEPSAAVSGVTFDIQFDRLGGIEQRLDALTSAMLDPQARNHLRAENHPDLTRENLAMGGLWRDAMLELSSARTEVEAKLAAYDALMLLDRHQHQDLSGELVPGFLAQLARMARQTVAHRALMNRPFY